MNTGCFEILFYPRHKPCPTTSPPQMAAGINQTLVRKVNTYYILTNLDSFKTLLEKYPESSIFIWSTNNDFFLPLSLVCPYKSKYKGLATGEKIVKKIQRECWLIYLRQSYLLILA